ncbi:hypothetical protein F0262_04605 [Vibrio rotiferianus]|uniref:Uncharacterized protein n=1 Tax=Vibrio rotiferianus TaxID=190895 RepID=A0A7Y4E0R6_9VIBR|nr:hypothetical protein [Vibrio rotiferianus]
MDETMVFWLGFYLFFLCLSTFVGYLKNNVIAGVLLGYVLGPIGFLLLLLSQDRKHGRCPYCQRKVNVQAYFCPHCENKCYKQLILK